MGSRFNSEKIDFDGATFNLTPDKPRTTRPDATPYALAAIGIALVGTVLSVMLLLLAGSIWILGLAVQSVQ